MLARRRNGIAFVAGLLLAAFIRPGAEAATVFAPAPLPAPVLELPGVPLPSPPVPRPRRSPPRPQPRVSRRWDHHRNAHPKKGQFRRFFRMTATAYTPINTRMEGGRRTRTLRDGRSAHGVAVDPDLIPLGTRLWIPGYGHGIADDTGGRIQGHRVDLRVQDYDQMAVWGVRRVRVYVLDDP